MPGFTWLKRLLIRWLGIDYQWQKIALMSDEMAWMEEQLRVYRLYLADAVVLPPGREILLSWRKPVPPLNPADLIARYEVPEKYVFWAR